MDPWKVIMTLWILLRLRGGPLWCNGKHCRYGVIMTFDISGVEGWIPGEWWQTLEVGSDHDLWHIWGWGVVPWGVLANAGGREWSWPLTYLGLKGGSLASDGKHWRYGVIMTFDISGVEGWTLGSIGKHWRLGVIMTFDISGVEGWTPGEWWQTLEVGSDHYSLDITGVKGWNPGEYWQILEGGILGILLGFKGAPFTRLFESGFAPT